MTPGSASGDGSGPATVVVGAGSVVVVDPADVGAPVSVVPEPADVVAEDEVVRCAVVELPEVSGSPPQAAASNPMARVRERSRLVTAGHGSRMAGHDLDRGSRGGRTDQPSSNRPTVPIHTVEANYEEMVHALRPGQRDDVVLPRGR